MGLGFLGLGVRLVRVCFFRVQTALGNRDESDFDPVDQNGF